MIEKRRTNCCITSSFDSFPTVTQLRQREVTTPLLLSSSPMCHLISNVTSISRAEHAPANVRASLKKKALKKLMTTQLVLVIPVKDLAFARA
jgi:hypothetical protein